jgi:orotidine-5'-phosphate decarboxylase
MNREKVKNRLICALDVDNGEEAKAMVETLGDAVSFYKVGIILQLTTGSSVIDYLLAKGKKVFLDMKYYDVPDTVEKAVAGVAGLGVSFLTIHGNSKIIESAARARGDSQLKLLTVTVLTSLDRVDVEDLGFQCSVEELVLRRAKKAFEYGCDGVISSPNEIEAIRNEVGNEFLIVTPGIRQSADVVGGHKRFATPEEAIRRGADYIVVGKPIIQAPDPRQAALGIIDSMTLGLPA